MIFRLKRSVRSFITKYDRVFLFVCLSFVLIGLYGCEPFLPQERQALNRSPSRIRVLTYNHPLVYQKDSHQTWGVDYELLSLWAERYNLSLEFKVYKNQEEVIAAFERQEGDIAAARLPTVHGNVRNLSGPALEETQMRLYCLRKAKIEDISDLEGKRISVRSKDLTADVLNHFSRLDNPPEFVQAKASSTRDLLLSVVKKEVDCTIVEKVEGLYGSQSYLMLEDVMAVSTPWSISWWAQSRHPELVTLMQIWFQKASRNDQVMRVFDRYTSPLDQLDSSDIRSFYKNIRESLPQYLKSFKEAGKEYRIPWEMIAAVAYQESHWQADAESYTGVKGLMQITQETARHLGLKDRENPQESLWGGAKYLRYLFHTTPSNIDLKERWALALASYNIGLAHLKDAQKLALDKGLNPFSWRDIKKILPTLSDPHVHENLDYGYARGAETVEFVERSFAFYKLLALRD